MLLRVNAENVHYEKIDGDAQRGARDEFPGVGLLEAGKVMQADGIVFARKLICGAQDGFKTSNKQECLPNS